MVRRTYKAMALLALQDLNKNNLKTPRSALKVTRECIRQFGVGIESCSRIFRALKQLDAEGKVARVRNSFFLPRGKNVKRGIVKRAAKKEVPRKAVRKIAAKKERPIKEKKSKERKRKAEDDLVAEQPQPKRKKLFEERTMKSTGPYSGVTEIVFSFDTTGSMGAAIEQAKKKITETTKRLFTDVPHLRIGIISHGDYCDGPTNALRMLDLTNNCTGIIDFVNNVPHTGGGDAEENYEMVLERVKSMGWTPGSVRSLVLIGDYTPHKPSDTLNQMKSYRFDNPRAIDWQVEADQLYEMGVKVYAVQCSNFQNESVTSFYEEVAQRTVGTRITLDNFSSVTDMILAVCFKEKSVEQFQVFEKEIIAEGRMSSSTHRMFRQISREIPTA